MAKKILFFYSVKESGHYQAAEAVCNAFRIFYPEVETILVSGISDAAPRATKLANAFYLEMLRMMPAFWGYLYDNPGIKEGTTEARELLLQLNKKKFLALIYKHLPDVIICTQAIPCVVIADARQKGKITTPLVTIITDYGAHIYWPEQGVDKYIVPILEVKKSFQNRGIPAERIKTMGIPIDPMFKTSIPKDQARVRLGLKANLSTVLIMGGTQGLGPIEEVMRSLDAVRMPFQAVVVTGTNKPLYRMLKNIVTKLHYPVRVFSFTRRVNKIMDAADFIITKPGGVTTAEVMTKSLPMVIVHPLPGQEEYNTDYLTKIGVARKVDKLKHLPKVIKELLKGEELEIMSRRCKELARPNAAREIAREIIELA